MAAVILHSSRKLQGCLLLRVVFGAAVELCINSGKVAPHQHTVFVHVVPL